MDFVAIDVESASADPASICQIGLAVVRAGRIVETVSQYIDPKVPFAPFNIELTGISPATVRGAPDYRGFFPELSRHLEGAIVVSHSSYDRTAVNRASERAGLTAPEARWLDSIRAARAAWPGRRGGAGYGLAALARDLGLEFRHHDAAEDARVAAEVVLRAVETTGAALTDWLSGAPKPRASAKAYRPAPNLVGPFYGRSLAFTGTMGISRRKAAELAARLGFSVTERIGPNTDILVLGNRSLGTAPSAKLREARALIAAGAPMAVLPEAHFLALLSRLPAEARDLIE